MNEKPKPQDRLTAALHRLAVEAVDRRATAPLNREERELLAIPTPR